MLIFIGLDEAGYTFNTHIIRENLVFVGNDVDWQPRCIEIS